MRFYLNVNYNSSQLSSTQRIRRTTELNLTGFDKNMMAVASNGLRVTRTNRVTAILRQLRYCLDAQEYHCTSRWLLRSVPCV